MAAQDASSNSPASNSPPVSSSAAPSAALSSGGVVYVIPINGMIERALVYAIRRGVNEAVQNGAQAIIFDMNTPGGRLDATMDIVNIISSIKVKTYTFVNPHAFSAGAIIAMGTDHIYMTPGGLIGDSMPVAMSPVPGEGTQAIPGDLKEKAVSPTAALMRSAAQRKGHDPKLAEAMVRSEIGFSIDGKIICPTNQLLTMTADEAGQMVGEEGKQRHLLSEGTVADLPELLVKIGHSNARVETITISSAEQVARIIDGDPWSSILLALGLLALYLEFKTPGVILPGIVGVILLAIWFWGHNIAGLAGMGDMLLFIIGAILVFVEVIFLPTMGILGVVGVGCMAVALFMSMMGHLPEWTPPELRMGRINETLKNFGMAFLITGVLAAIAARFLPKTQLFGHLMLHTSVSKEDGYQAASAAEANKLIGLRGKAETFLRPAGIGVFGEKHLDVVTRDGQFLPQNTSIVIAEAHGNRIVVEAVSDTEASRKGKS